MLSALFFSQNFAVYKSYIYMLLMALPKLKIAACNATGCVSLLSVLTYCCQRLCPACEDEESEVSFF